METINYWIIKKIQKRNQFSIRGKKWHLEGNIHRRTKQWKKTQWQRNLRLWLWSQTRSRVEKWIKEWQMYLLHLRWECPCLRIQKWKTKWEADQVPQGWKKIGTIILWWFLPREKKMVQWNECLPAGINLAVRLQDQMIIKVNKIKSHPLLLKSQTSVLVDGTFN